MNNLPVFRHEIARILLGGWSGNLPVWKLFFLHWSLGWISVLFGFYSTVWLTSSGFVTIAQQLYGLTLAFIICHTIYISVSGWRSATKFNSVLPTLVIKAALLLYVVLVLRIINFIPAPGLQFGA